MVSRELSEGGKCLAGSLSDEYPFHRGTFSTVLGSDVTNGDQALGTRQDRTLQALSKYLARKQPCKAFR